jgi:hypothetical protein
VGEEAFARYAACVLASEDYDGIRHCEVTSELDPYLCRQLTFFKRSALEAKGETLYAPAFFAAEEECLSLAEPARSSTTGPTAPSSSAPQPRPTSPRATPAWSPHAPATAVLETTRPDAVYAGALRSSEAEALRSKSVPSDLSVRSPRDDKTPTLCAPGP